MMSIQFQMESNPIQNNPIYKEPTGPNSPYDSQMPGEDDDYDGMPPPSYNSAMGSRGGGWVSVDTIMHAAHTVVWALI